MTAPQHIRRALLLILALLLAACGSGAGATPTPPPAAPPAAASRTLLILWHAWPAGEQRALNSLIERFNRANPAIQVVPQARPATSLTADLAAAVAEGGGPHLAIVRSHTLGALAEDGLIQPLDGALPDEELARLLPAARGAGQVRIGADSPIYGVPITFDTLALYYNTAYFPGAPPANTAALLDAGHGLTNPRSDPPVWGLAYNLSLERTIGYLYAFDGQIFDAQGELILGLEGRAGVEAWLRWLGELHRDERLLASLDGIAVDSALMTDAVAMTIDWSSALASYRGLWPESLGVAPLPRLFEQDRAPLPYVQSDTLALNARIAAPTERAAVEMFVRFLVSAEAQAELLRAGRQPVLLSLDLNDPALAEPVLLAAARVFRAQAEQGQPMPNSRAANEIVRAALIAMQTSALRGLLTPEQAVAEADALLRQRLGLPSASAP